MLGGQTNLYIGQWRELWNISERQLSWELLLKVDNFIKNMPKWHASKVISKTSQLISKKIKLTERWRVIRTSLVDWYERIYLCSREWDEERKSNHYQICLTMIFIVVFYLWLPLAWIISSSNNPLRESEWITIQGDIWVELER